MILMWGAPASASTLRINLHHHPHQAGRHGAQAWQLDDAAEPIKSSPAYLIADTAQPCGQGHTRLADLVHSSYTGASTRFIFSLGPEWSLVLVSARRQQHTTACS